eukprot:5481628-Amphidinium_carterae.1
MAAGHDASLSGMQSRVGSWSLLKEISYNTQYGMSALCVCILAQGSLECSTALRSMLTGPPQHICQPAKGGVCCAARGSADASASQSKEQHKYSKRGKRQ